MIIPIRCFSCGKPIAQDWEKYSKRTSGGETPEKVLHDLGYERYCCRRMFLSHSASMEEVMVYRRF